LSQTGCNFFKFLELLLQAEDLELAQWGAESVCNASPALPASAAAARADASASDDAEESSDCDSQSESESDGQAEPEVDADAIATASTEANALSQPELVDFLGPTEEHAEGLRWQLLSRQKAETGAILAKLQAIRHRQVQLNSQKASSLSRTAKIQAGLNQLAHEQDRLAALSRACDSEYATAQAAQQASQAAHQQQLEVFMKWYIGVVGTEKVPVSAPTQPFYLELVQRQREKRAATSPSSPPTSKRVSSQAGTPSTHSTLA
jgi:hypothetical protein